MTTLNEFNKVDNTTSVLAAHINDLIASTLRSEYSNVETLSGTRTLLDVDTPIQRFDCNGTNRIVLCPTANTDDNHPFLLVNASDGGETITVKNNAGSVTLATLAEGSAVLILPDGAGAYVVASGGVQSVVAGTNVTVDNTDPANPVVNASGGGGAGGGDTTRTSYIITPSIASNNLTVALKYIDGNDPTSTNKLTFRIGNTEYELTTAMSFTKNAGTDLCSVGGTRFSAKNVQLFMYAIGETGGSAGLKFGFSRIPYAKTMGDFVNTTTSEKYIAGNWTNFNSTDEVTNIGRFQTQNSGTASYNWSIPTANVVNYPIYETEWLTWLPTISAGYSANPTNVVYMYKVVNTECWLIIREGSSGTSNTTADAVYSLPFTALTLSNAAWYGTHQYLNNGTADVIGGCIISSGGSTITFFRNLGATWTASGSRRIIALTQGMFFPIG